MSELNTVLKKENETPEEEYARLGFNYYRHPFHSAKITPYTKAEKKAVFSLILMEAYAAGEYMPGQKGTYRRLEDFCKKPHIELLPEIDANSLSQEVVSQILTDFFKKNTWEIKEEVLKSYFYANRRYKRNLYTDAGFDYREIEERQLAKG